MIGRESERIGPQGLRTESESNSLKRLPQGLVFWGRHRNHPETRNHGKFAALIS